MTVHDGGKRYAMVSLRLNAHIERIRDKRLVTAQDGHFSNRMATGCPHLRQIPEYVKASATALACEYSSLLSAR